MEKKKKKKKKEKKTKKYLHFCFVHEEVGLVLSYSTSLKHCGHCFAPFWFAGNW
jgi:hypothetical protein